MARTSERRRLRRRRNVQYRLGMLIACNPARRFLKGEAGDFSSFSIFFLVVRSFLPSNHEDDDHLSQRAVSIRKRLKIYKLHYKFDNFIFIKIFIFFYSTILLKI